MGDGIDSNPCCTRYFNQDGFEEKVNRLLGRMDASKNSLSSGLHHTKPPPDQIDVLPKTFVQIILAAKGSVPDLDPSINKLMGSK